MTTTLTIDAVPPIEITAEIIDIGTARATLNGEIPNVDVTLDNARGQITDLFTVPPLRASASITRDGAPLFVGRVQGVRMSDIITVTIEQ